MQLECAWGAVGRGTSAAAAAPHRADARMCAAGQSCRRGALAACSFPNSCKAAAAARGSSCRAPSSRCSAPLATQLSRSSAGPHSLTAETAAHRGAWVRTASTGTGGSHRFSRLPWWARVLLLGIVCLTALGSMLVDVQFRIRKSTPAVRSFPSARHSSVQDTPLHGIARFRKVRRSSPAVRPFPSAWHSTVCWVCGNDGSLASERRHGLSQLDACATTTACSAWFQQWHRVLQRQFFRCGFNNGTAPALVARVARHLHLPHQLSVVLKDCRAHCAGRDAVSPL